MLSCPVSGSHDTAKRNRKRDRTSRKWQLMSALALTHDSGLAHQRTACMSIFNSSLSTVISPLSIIHCPLSIINYTLSTIICPLSIIKSIARVAGVNACVTGLSYFEKSGSMKCSTRQKWGRSRCHACRTASLACIFR